MDKDLIWIANLLLELYQEKILTSKEVNNLDKSLRDYNGQTTKNH